MSGFPEEIEDLMVAASLGVATPEEVVEIERAAATDPLLAKRLGELRQTTLLLAEDVPNVTPRRRVRKRLLVAARSEGRSAHERGRGRLSWIAPAIGGAAIAAAISIGVVTGLDGGVRDDVREIPVEQVASRTVAGELVILGNGEPSVLRLRGLPELPRGFGYEVWRFTGSTVRSGGFLEVTADGRGVAALPDAAAADRIAVTAELRSNTDAPTREPIVQIDV